MSQSVLGSEDPGSLSYIITHVFCPLQLPDGDDHTLDNDRSLCGAVASAARLYLEYADEDNLPHWQRILRMIDNLRDITQLECLSYSPVLSQLTSMGVGDILVFFIRAQNAVVVFRKQHDVTVVESFEVSPIAQDVMTTQGKLICSYPGPAIEISNDVFDDPTFVSELVNFLVHMNKDILDAVATSQKAHNTVHETRDTTHPRYITELLTGILRSVGRPANVTRISKRVGDDVVWNNSELPWRRSSLWLVIRVALQTSLTQLALGRDAYKAFILFFMCCLAKDQLSNDLPNDLLQFMLAKISRRLRKLGSFAPDWLSTTILSTCTRLRSTLEKRWVQVQAAQSVSSVWTPSELDLSRDTQLLLPGSGDHIRDILSSHDITTGGTRFAPKHHVRGTLDDFLSSDGSFFEAAYRAEPHVALYDVEQAIEKEIDQWVDQVTNNDDACEKLELLAENYFSRALQDYENNPELMSIMLLTTIELWIALDKIAIRDIPMLADYSPEIPLSLLERLLLFKATCLHRLCLAQEYLAGRHNHCFWSVFSREMTTNNFAVRFYNQSSHLKRLKAEIENKAHCEVRDKIDELRTMNAEYAKLQREAASANHEYIINWRGYECHSYHCRKCSLERQCQDMKITIHEWPLPAKELWAEAVVFELDCPVSFNMWRSATSRLLVNICSPSIETKDPYVTLCDYSSLKHYLVQHPRSRITLASDAKPMLATHYKSPSIPSTQDNVCVENGLRFYGFDRHAGIPTSEVSNNVNIRNFCTHKLPTGEYETLQKYVDSTLCSSNEVMANQADCHIALSIHEYLAFGHLRCGELLQWLNVLRELRARSLTFRRPEVHLILAQIASQVGPLQSMQLEWHRDLQQKSFCCALLEELESLVRDVESNWMELVTMDTVSFLLRRLLASTPDPDISCRTTGLLRAVRGRVFAWVEELSEMLKKSPGDADLGGHLRAASVTCRSTFDVDTFMIPDLLHSAEDVVVLICCAAFIHDHTPSQLSSLSSYSQLLLSRDRRLSLAVEDTLRTVIQADPDNKGINLALKKLWAGYRPCSKWFPLEASNSRWISSATAPTDEERSQMVYYNLLDGTLLVDGKPLGRLPGEIQVHPLYNLIFGKHVLEIIPSGLSGMDYSTRDKISDHIVHFGLRNGDLIIRATWGDVDGHSEIMELIPQGKLEGDLPAVFIEGHVHWLNIHASTLEIRPLSTIWGSSCDNWVIDCTFDRYRMHKGHEVLVDIRSKTWTMIAALLKPLEAPSNLVITASPVEQSSSLRLCIALPRYDLSFYVDEDGDLQSYNMRGMVYDENQSIGTFFGLVNQLVLRPKRRILDTVELIPRCVLIPDGRALFYKVDHHVRVKIDTCGPALGQITYHTFKADTELGCLTGNVSLTSQLYCVYLHALTGGCGADPLTGRSGTEEALSLLRSASCWSIIKLTHRDAELLSSIASLCPPRIWYPEHRQCMQRVMWLDLPAISQHHDLYTVSKAIKEHCERVSLFYENQSSDLLEGFPFRDDGLLKRSAQRAAYMFPFEMSGKPARPDVDVHYHARDLVNGSGELRAYTAATAIFRRAYTATTAKNVLHMMESWCATISGRATLSLRYNNSWLSPNLPTIWLEAYQLLRRDDEEKWFQMLFTIPAMVYAKPDLGDLVPVFLAFALSPQFYHENPPSYPSYTISHGYSPSPDTLRSHFSDCAHSFQHSPEGLELARYYEPSSELRERQLKAYRSRLESDTTRTVNKLLNSWPCDTLPWLPLDDDLYNHASFTSNAQHYFSSCYKNLRLKEHINRVQSILEGIHSQAISCSQYSFHPSPTPASHAVWPLTMDHLLARPAPSLRMHDRLSLDAADSNESPLCRLITTVERKADNSFQCQYISALRISARHLGREASPSPKIFVMHYVQCRDRYNEAIRDITQCLGPMSLCDLALKQSGQWPCITPYSLFRSLASNAPITLTDDWKRCLITLALIALEIQRTRRLLRLLSNNLLDEVQRELQNEGCDSWKAEIHPDWLLIQLQGNFLIRRVQAEVSKEMISPFSGENTAMQLNMGEGKSSVIVPISVVVLANGHQLVRVIVPKTLTVQMFYILVDLLGRLANRRLYFLPFSRSAIKLDERVSALCELMKECMKGRGILIAQPEHILSLKLLSVEKQLPSTDDTRLAGKLLELQRWLYCHSRDILDESDEILHVRYQLAYTIGTQRHMEGFPERWTTTQQILGLVCKHAPSLRHTFPLEVEYYECGQPGSFPHLRILHANAGQRLVAWIAQDVLDGHLPNFNLGHLRSETKDAIQSFILCENVRPEDIQLVKDYSKDTSLWCGLLHLRGLLACGILLFAFTERRWRVDYGLMPERTMLAVPYRAKDVPAQRAEFGHPDITIVLTSLSYYYNGLNEEQLKFSFDILLKQDDPSPDYGLWVQACATVPKSLQTLNGLNINSLDQWKKYLCPLFQRNRATVDFYLSHVVFPKEAKEFPSKLSCSGWDLAEKKRCLLTGFSGTNDGQYLLPLHIAQRDPDHQRGTNAKVLSYLLQPENKHYMCMSQDGGKRQSTHEFLKILVEQDPPIRTLLDVGAQMLDLRNCELAEAWLEIYPNASAAIYFDDDDELTVRTRDRRTQPLRSSPFAQQLDRCVVYLDDAHTRGTDIKFPVGYRAAVTLGPKVTKDRLVQGCMRMRNLGHGHSVMFFAPPEVDRRIRTLAQKDSEDAIYTMDILHSIIHETCNDIQQRVPHWAQQGIDHTARYDAWTKFCEGQLTSQELSDKWLQPEAKRLEDLYAPHNAGLPSLAAFPEIRQRCTELGILKLNDVSMDEEQEREVLHEAERERQVERPPIVPAVRHNIHQDVTEFIRTGVVPTGSRAFCPAFKWLNTATSVISESHIWSQRLFVTMDFANTVRSSGKLDEYLRPVQWVVSGTSADKAAFVILSPYEVNSLMPNIRSSDTVRLHLYTPRVIKSMKPCDDLVLYNIPTVPAAGWTRPSILMDQLNVFAGQLYLKDHETYKRLCRFLCVYTRDLESEDVEVGYDGFIAPNNRPQHLRGAGSTFQHSPLASLKTLMALRRKGMRFAPSDMGKILDGHLLDEGYFLD